MKIWQLLAVFVECYGNLTENIEWDVWNLFSVFCFGTYSESGQTVSRMANRVFTFLDGCPFFVQFVY